MLDTTESNTRTAAAYILDLTPLSGRINKLPFQERRSQSGLNLFTVPSVLLSFTTSSGSRLLGLRYQIGKRSGLESSRASHHIPFKRVSAARLWNARSHRPYSLR